MKKRSNKKNKENNNKDKWFKELSNNKYKKKSLCNIKK